jgi:hypothetical protein
MIDPTYIDNDIFCTKTPFDPTLFPAGSAKFLDRNYNILPFLCDLLKYANDETVSPVLQEPTDLDITPFTDFTGLSAVGDPRVPLGEVMEATFIYFLPRMITQTEVLQAGGTQVIDNVICNSDGVPIKQSQTIPILLSLDLSGKKPYQYGALTVPPVSATFEDLMMRIEPDEIKKYVNDYIYNAKKEHITFFVQFINDYFLTKGWVPTLLGYNTPPLFLIKLTKDDKIVYIKYHTDVQNETGCALGINSILTHFGTTNIDNRAMIIALGSEIQDYKKLMQDPDKAQKWYDYLTTTTIATLADNWSNLFTNTSAATAYMARMDQLYVPVTSAVDITCAPNIY